MEKDRLSRELAVILHADVVGSTRLVQKDEVLAHQRIQTVFKSFSKTIGQQVWDTHFGYFTLSNRVREFTRDGRK